MKLTEAKFKVLLRKMINEELSSRPSILGDALAVEFVNLASRTKDALAMNVERRIDADSMLIPSKIEDIESEARAQANVALRQLYNDHEIKQALLAIFEEIAKKALSNSLGD